ncbi:type II secretion system F family protein [uncultured Desulfuromonas sp.]|uniref:type II secretion system F family protein n=1 Tax=uncultured Desulfuromonas sp. TaxID=181013 RepID=UPI002AAAAF3D|nr:type II secretion system F family protein [uncultured Desulfuromonas sp.]
MENCIYDYKAISPQGDVVTGQLQASSEAAAAMVLQQRGLTPLRIQADGSTAIQKKSRVKVKTAKPAAKSRSNERFSLPTLQRRASTRDLVMFSQDLAALLNAGVPLPRSLKIIAELVEKKSFEAVIVDLHEQIKQGSTFWEALESHPNCFSPVFVHMVKAGEAGGVLDRVLERLGSYLDGVQELKEYLLSAMMYPLFLLVTAMASVTVLLTVVVPKFSVIFGDMGVALPFSTRVLLGMGTFLQNYWWAVLLVVIAMVVSIRLYSRSQTGRKRLDHLKLCLPGLGSLFKRIEISRFCRTFGTLLTSGIPILSSLQMVRGVLGNVVLSSSVKNVHAELKQGGTLSESLAATGFFPAMAIQMIAIGEETGRMDQMLVRIADMYDREIRVTIKSFTSLFEPLIILLMGLVIGAMVISMLLAIFSVNDMGF